MTEQPFVAVQMVHSVMSVVVAVGGLIKDSLDDNSL